MGSMSCRLTRSIMHTSFEARIPEQGAAGMGKESMTPSKLDVKTTQLPSLKS